MRQIQAIDCQAGLVWRGGGTRPTRAVCPVKRLAGSPVARGGASQCPEAGEGDSSCAAAWQAAFTHWHALPSAISPVAARGAGVLAASAGSHAAHLGHTGGAGWLATAAAASGFSDEAAGWKEIQQATSDRDRQQHETPPKIWLNATANSNTSWSG